VSRPGIWNGRTSLSTITLMYVGYQTLNCDLLDKSTSPLE
jgi:hypothetical protein